MKSSLAVVSIKNQPDAISVQTTKAIIRLSKTCKVLLMKDKKPHRVTADQINIGDELVCYGIE